MTESDDPKTLVGGLLGQGLPGGFPARKAVRGIQGSIFGDDEDGTKDADSRGRSGSRRTGGTAAENRIATNKARKQRRLQSSSLTSGLGVIS